VEKRLTCTSSFLSQGGKLEMVNSVFSSSAIFYTGSLKLHKGVIKQLDKYRKHCLWRGSDWNSKKPPKAAWPMVCLPKKQGGIGVIDLNTHNEAMLLKFLHKFYTKADIPWVRLVWENYYGNGKLPGQIKKGSFWWRDIVKLLDKYKSLASVLVAIGDTVLLWSDKWNGNIPAQLFPELLSFARNPVITLQAAINKPLFLSNFFLPLSAQAHVQQQQLSILISNRPAVGDLDLWSYSWGNAKFSTAKAYKALVGSRPTHPAFLWIWRSKCQMKHKVFFWLLLKDRLSTRDLLQRQHLELDSYTCDLCIRRKVETMAHLFFRCNFAKACWSSIGASVLTSRPVFQILKLLKDKLAVPFYMEIIILMTWAIWTTRNAWIFSNIYPLVQDCKRKFLSEFSLLLHRVKYEMVNPMEVWLNVV
jgi:hypothetical protein